MIFYFLFYESGSKQKNPVGMPFTLSVNHFSKKKKKENTKDRRHFLSFIGIFFFFHFGNFKMKTTAERIV